MLYANCGNDNGNGNGCSNNGVSIGPQGPAGQNGVNGTNGTNGANGVNGSNGANGKDGTNGLNGTDATMQSRLLGELNVRVWDTKRTSFVIFDSYNFNDGQNKDIVMDGRNAFYGFRFGIKLGTSHEERLLEKQAAQIKALEAMVSRLAK